MLSFSQLILLVEDRIKFLKDSNKEISTAHDALAVHKEPHDIIDHFASHDPHPKKAYTQWIINQYKKGHIRQEDGPRIHDTLKNFDRYKGKLDRKDVNQYKHISHLEDAVEPHVGTVASNKEQKKLIKHEGADLIHSENGVTVHKIKTKEAACHYGAGTKWCTAAEKNNMFDHYNEHGPLYVVQTPEREVHGLSTRGPVKLPPSKYQFHFETRQFMNEKDTPIDTHQLTRSYPELTNVKEFHGGDEPTLAHAPFMHEEDKKHLYDHIVNHGEEDDQVKLAKLSDVHAREMILKDPKKTQNMSYFSQNKIARVILDYHDHLIDDEDVAHKLRNASDFGVRADMLAKGKKHAEKMIDDPHHVIRKFIVEKHPDLAHHFINDPHEEVRAKVAEHPEHAHHFINDSSGYVRWNAAAHSLEVAKHLVNDTDVGVRSVIAYHHPSLAHHFINDPDSNVRVNASEHRRVAEKMINDPSEHVRKNIAIKHPDLAHHFITDPHDEVRNYSTVSYVSRNGSEEYKKALLNKGVPEDIASSRAEYYALFNKK